MLIDFESDLCLDMDEVHCESNKMNFFGSVLDTLEE